MKIVAKTTTLIAGRIGFDFGPLRFSGGTK